MERHLLDIVQLAWCRELALDDHALTAGGRVVRVDDTADRLQVLRLGETTAVVGPGDAVAAVDRIPAEALDAATVREATGGHGARSHVLHYCADWIDASRVRDPLISHDARDLAELRRRCPPDDTIDATPADGDRVFVLLDDDHRPLSAAGYGEVHSILADVVALTVPEHRRLGLASTVATLATHEALDAGLIPQCRVRRDNLAGRGLAAVLGYEECGSHLTVQLRR
ncbi:GNAT family N-acetyltransferase [Rhodococcus sp. NPDC003382]|uniref:GNAT family N-acetyltransferase n=1 Tax=unclassified Rhodococcus (in: high G+C Gram-positive bacteria) TaxID=192944 RepID=UPI0018CE331E|nr:MULTISPECIES: GNAT family N-acetyltransferase [unclassified Rhodococcus (in: high G+C Gram-positive bacteria)]MBH0122725.1 GNAT family N-acetyltransferase [Rhodococcus sp. CX]MCK8671853.1 GNAT family N-acetyltransferase [Rhodococcus sp. HM1]